MVAAAAVVVAAAAAAAAAVFVVAVVVDIIFVIIFYLADYACLHDSFPGWAGGVPKGMEYSFVNTFVASRFYFLVSASIR